MDLSGLKWPLIIIVVLGIGWLASSGGVNYMHNNFTSATPGQDAQRDTVDEAGLTRLANYLLYLWRYDKAEEVLLAALTRYGPNGQNYHVNTYRLALVYEKQRRYQEAYNVLQDLIAIDAQQYDNRVPNRDNLALRAQKLKEIHELQ